MASRSWNRIELIGNLTRDPELRFIPSGTAVASFGLATNRTYMSDGERKEEVDFHKIVAWGKLAELCNQLLKKGAKVFISGRLQYREWQGQDGVKRRDAEVVLEDMVLITPKSSSYSSGSSGEEVHEDIQPEVDRPVVDKVEELVKASLPEADEKEKQEEEAPKKEDPSTHSTSSGRAKEDAVNENVDIAADKDLPF